ncbi:hypothetical protein LCGC14_1956900 [marine sediment metagenome]|uniref:Uncharacterized protein n=1 Tax=marine sediment metagenome TaxID=412755 RepID=A0A0F9ICV0_9ZZZZ
MGDYAMFMYRPKREKHNELLLALQKTKASIRDVKYDSQLGIIYGVAKTSYPGGCKLALKYEIDVDLYEALAVVNAHEMHNSDYFYSETMKIDTDMN